MSKSHVFFFDVRNTLGVGPPARGSIRSAELKNLEATFGVYKTYQADGQASVIT
jgi:hypothetical protein